MTVTQDTLIRQIAEKENLNPATVHEIFRSAEDIVFGYLSSSPSSEKITVKLMNGISIERKYVDEKEYTKGMFQNILCPEHVNVKASSSRYYGRQINEKLFCK